MKKNGFTLAEVLITLAIIGVVATLTLPSLMTNTQEQQALTAFKKLMNTLNEAGQMNAAMEGFDYSSATGFGNIDDRIDQNSQTIAALINERLQVSVAASGGNFGQCQNAFVLRDATTICLAGEFAQGGYQHIWVDTNGPKGPNLASTCNEDATCTDKESRNIYDQFHVTLRNGIAIPGWVDRMDEEEESGEGYAATYAMGSSRRD